MDGYFASLVNPVDCHEKSSDFSRNDGIDLILDCHDLTASNLAMIEDSRESNESNFFGFFATIRMTKNFNFLDSSD